MIAGAHKVAAPPSEAQTNDLRATYVKPIASVCPYSSVGCGINVHVKGAEGWDWALDDIATRVKETRDRTFTSNVKSRGGELLGPCTFSGGKSTGWI